MPPARDAWALFLDVDGTLAPFTANPADARVPLPVVECVSELHATLDRALALVSGRRIADVDRIVAPARLPAAGIHGAEWRIGSSVVPRMGAPPAALGTAREALDAFRRDHAGTIVEDKRWAVALHFRRHPAAAATAVALGRRLVRSHEDELELVEGDMVVEIRVRGVNKGGAVAAFLEVPPFGGRRPVYVGDDTTDEDAFRVVNERSGISVNVGARSPTAARYRLVSVNHVHHWLDRLARHLRRDAVDE